MAKEAMVSSTTPSAKAQATAVQPQDRSAIVPMRLSRRAAIASLASMNGPAQAVAASERKIWAGETYGSAKASRRPEANSMADPVSPHAVRPTAKA